MVITLDQILPSVAGMPRIALTAHDSKKQDLLELLNEHLQLLKSSCLVATHGTGVLLAVNLGLFLTLVKSGPMGGDQEIGALIAKGKLDAVIFLRDALAAQAHEPDISALLRLCDAHNVPLATNLATARAVLAHILAPLARKRNKAGPCSVLASLAGAEAVSGGNRGYG